MSKVLRPLAIIAAIAINVIPGAGQAISGALVGALGGTFAAVGAAATITGIATAALTVAGLSAASSLLQRKPKFETSGITGRLQLSDQVDQWIAVGETALPSQMIFWGTSGGENKELSIIVAHACHAIHSFTGLTINGVSTTYPTPGGDYAGILTIQTAIGTHTTNPFTGIQGGWTGPGRDLAMSHFRWTYNQEKLTSGLPQNIQFTGKGIRVYDPRRDSTRGGSGTMRADDETTWAYEVGGTQLGNNPALVHLTYLLGWKKNGLLWAGKGESPTDISFADYIAAANICDELVSGERRYTIGGLISLAEAHNINEGRILSCCAGKKTDAGGLLGIWVAHDDTAVPLMSFNAGDIMGDIKWEPLPEGQTRNTARGSFLDPANGWTAQPYQEVRPTDLLALDNDVELVDRLDFPMVTNANQARRLAGVRLRESRQGIYTAPMRLKALGVQTGRVVAQTLAQQGWTNKRFRIETMTLERETVTLRGRAVAAGDYVDAGPSTLTPVAAPPTLGYVPFTEEGATRNVSRGTYDAGTGYVRGDEVVFSGSSYRLIVASSTGNAPPDASRWALFAAAGSGPPGADGLEGVTVIVSNEAHTVPTNADGSGGSYGSAGGTMIVRRGATLLTPTFSIAAQSPATGWASIDVSTGVYTVTDPGATLATATLRANVGGVNYDRTYTLAKSLQGVAGPNLTLVADGQAFTFTDGAVNPGGQTITLNALLTNLSGTATWSTTPAVTLGGSGNTRTLAVADFGTNRQVVIEATLGGITDRITLLRQERNIVAANAANRVRYSEMEGDRGWDVNFNPASLSVAEVFGTFGGKRFFAAIATTTAAAQVVVIGQVGAPAAQFAVTPGERLSVQARVDAFGAVDEWALSIWWVGADGTRQQGALTSGFGDIFSSVVQQAFVTAPAIITASGSPVVGGYLDLAAESDGAGTMQLSFVQPMVAGAAADQTVHPAYTKGPNAADGADVTRDTLPALQRGAWSASSVAYALGDIVTRAGSSYTCIVAHTSTGGNGPPGSNWALLADAGAQGATGVSAPPIKSLSTGAAQLDPVRLTNGQTVTVTAELYLNTGGVAGVCSLELQISEAGAGSWATMTGGTVTDSQPTTESVELVIAGATFTNGGPDRLFDIRAVSVRQGRVVNVPPSFVRVL